MSESNPNSRLEAFCDGVFAIALTLLIIDVKIPPNVEIASTAGFWQALRHILPTISAFVLSFVIILINWVNHHSVMKLVNKSSPAFIYANGFMLLTVVFLPFPTSLLGEYLFTDHGTPAVILFNVCMVLNGVSWILFCSAAIHYQLTRNEKAAGQMRTNRKHGYFAVLVYSGLTLMAFWFPISIAAIVTLLWIFWLIYGVRMSNA